MTTPETRARARLRNTVRGVAAALVVLVACLVIGPIDPTLLADEVKFLIGLLLGVVAMLWFLRGRK